MMISLKLSQLVKSAVEKNLQTDQTIIKEKENFD